MFKTDKDKKKIESLGKNPLNYESTWNETSVLDQKPVRIHEFNEVEEKEIAEGLERRKKKRREVAENSKLKKKKKKKKTGGK